MFWNINADNWKIINENAVLKSQFKHESKNYKLIYEKIKTFQETINNMSIEENILAEERNDIMWV